MQTDTELTPIQEKVKLEELCRIYTNYLKINREETDSVRAVIDNIYTRLEEFTSVLHMIQTKDVKCVQSIVDEVLLYKAEMDMVSKKMDTLDALVATVRSQVNNLEKNVEKAESDFGISTESKISKMFKPFFNRNKDAARTPASDQPVEPIKVDSVAAFFEKNP